MNPFSPTTASKAAFLVAALVGATYLTEVAFGGQMQEVGPGPQEGEEQENERPDQDPDYVDPQEIRDVIKQFNDLRREVKRTLKMLAKVPNSGDDKGKLNGLLEQLAIWEKNLRNPPADTSKREVLQEFYDANVWDDINNVRRKAELPKNIREGEKALARSEKVWKSPRAKKYLSDLIPKVNEFLGNVRGALEAAKVALASGDLESAEEAMQTTYENHPGEVEGIFHMMSSIREGLKRVKDPEVKAIIEEVLQPINESLAQGDFRDANQALNEVQNEISRVIEIASRAPKRRPQNFDDKLRRLEELLQQKFGGQEEFGPQPPPFEGPQPEAVPAG